MCKGGSVKYYFINQQLFIKSNGCSIHLHKARDQNGKDSDKWSLNVKNTKEKNERMFQLASLQHSTLNRFKGQHEKDVEKPYRHEISDIFSV